MPWGKLADHQSLLPQVQRNAQREWMKLSYQSRCAITWTKLQNSKDVLNWFISVRWVTGYWGWCAAVWKKNSSRVQYKDKLVVRLIAIKYTKRLLCYLSSYINLLMTDLWLDLNLWSKLHTQNSDPEMIYCLCLVCFSPNAGRNCTCYNYLFLTLFKCWFLELLTGLGIARTIWLYLLKYKRSKMEFTLWWITHSHPTIYQDLSA